MRDNYHYTSRQRYDPRGSSYRQPQRRRRPVGLSIAADVGVAALLLLVFYITNYVITPDVEGVPLGSPSSSISASVPPATPAPATSSEDTSATGTAASPSGTAQPTDAAASATPGQPGTLREKFADKFTSGDVEKTDTSYKSANVNVTIDKVQEDGVTYFVADIYVADIKYFKTGFGSTDKLGSRAFVADSLKTIGGIIGVNGDNCLDNPCLLIRNGVYYPKFTKTTSDALVMYNDGTMKTIPGGQLDMDAVKAEAPYQVWGFGPMLLKDGQPVTKFNSTVAGANPRTAIGYYEPGHYCFVAVDGRQPGYSSGLTMANLSNLFYQLGCKEAYNMDGGGTEQMAFLGNTINKPAQDFRKTYDYIYISDN